MSALASAVPFAATPAPPRAAREFSAKDTLLDLVNDLTEMPGVKLLSIVQNEAPHFRDSFPEVARRDQEVITIRVLVTR